MEHDTEFEISEEEKLDIASVRKWSKSPHVQDADALSAFREGRGVFDVGPHGSKLEAFIALNRLRVRRGADGGVLRMTALVDNRPVYFAFPE